MKRITLLRGAALALIAACCIGPVQAGTIEGALTFTGEVSAIPNDLSNAFALSFTANGFLVASATGTFEDSGIGFGSVGSLNDLIFDPFSPVVGFIQINFDPGPGKFSFDLQDLEIIDQGSSALTLAGSGTLGATGMGTADYNLTLSVDGQGSLFNFSGTLTPTVVPVPGALVLLGSALLALGARRRDWRFQRY